MMKHEFEKMADIEVSQSQYDKIETVYMYYPGDMDKVHFVGLFKTCGMAIIKDLFPRANELKDIESRIANAQKRASHLLSGTES